MNKFLRVVGIILMGLTAALTILSGIGTTCVALDATKYDGMEAIAQYQWLYILYVVLGLFIGVMGIRATINLVRGKTKAYNDAMIVLIAGVVTGIIHMITSRSLRDSSMPLDFIVYFTIFTFVIFLIFGIPSVKKWLGLEKGSDDDKTAAGGMAAIVAGMLFLSVHMWAGPTHIFDGVNLADAFHTYMMISGGFLLILGLGLLGYAAFSSAEVPERLPAEESLPG